MHVYIYTYTYTHKPAQKVLEREGRFLKKMYMYLYICKYKVMQTWNIYPKKKIKRQVFQEAREALYNDIHPYLTT